MTVWKVNGVEVGRACEIEVVDVVEQDVVNQWWADHRKHRLIGLSGLVGALEVGMSSPVAMAAVSYSGSGVEVKMRPLIRMVQDFALPVGIAVSIWGLIELMLGNSSGKQKIKTTIGCYVGVFLIPIVFYTIHDAFGA